MNRLLLNVVLGILLSAVVAVVGFGGWKVIWPQFILRQEVAKIVEGADERLQAAMIKADRLDPGWRLAEILDKREHDRMPDDSNSVIQVERVLSLLPKDWQRPEPDSNGGPLEPDEIPSGGRLFTLLADYGPNSRLPDNLAAGLRGELDQAAEAVEAARRLAEYPEGQTQIVPERNPLETRLPQTQNTRKVALLLLLDATRRADDGDSDGALESVRAQINTGRSIGDEPFLISQITRGAQSGDGAVRALERVLGQGEPSPRELARIQVELLRESRFPRLLVGLRGERAMMVDLCAKLDQGVLHISDIAESLNCTRSTDGYDLHPLTFRHNEALFLDQLTDDLETARKPLHEQVPHWESYYKRRQDLEIGSGQNANALYLSLTREWLTWRAKPYVPDKFMFSQRIAAKLNCAVAAVACECYRQGTGAWPSSLDRLVPEYLEQVPTDPYIGEPIRLARRDDGITIYAVGEDRHNDGGQLHPRHVGTEPSFDIGVRLFDPDHRALPADEPVQPPVVPSRF
jgi:hypothetical protein